MEDTQIPEQQPAMSPVSNGRKQKGNILMLVALALALIIVGVFLLNKSDEKKPTTNINNTTLAAIAQAAEVNITADGFSPATVKVKKGASVNWTNQDDATHQIAADPHPTHSSLPGLLGDPLNKGESYSYIFEKSGTYTYHDETNPTKFIGTVIVE